METTLVGYTGFVGGNLAKAHRFNNMYNSKNISESFGKQNGLVVYSGMPSEKFLANADPAADLARAENAMDNIRRMKPEELVLISTVDVYPKPFGVYEDTPAGGEGVSAYGHNRLMLEQWVRQEYPEALILRLPGLYGTGLKKNFIYDMLTLIPPALTEEKYAQLKTEPLVEKCYIKGDKGFYRLGETSQKEWNGLKNFFENGSFNSLCFTDSRAVFQFYNLPQLWADILRCRKAGLHLVNLATAPIEAGMLYHQLFGEEFENILDRPLPVYDMRTHYGREFGGLDDYISDRAEVISGIAKFASTFGQ